MLNRIYGTNAFEAVTYHLEGTEEPYVLVFDCQKGQVNDSAVGIRADTDETVSVILHLGLGTRRLSGPRLTTDIKLGTNPSFTVEGLLKSRIGLPSVGLTFRNRLLNSSSGWQSDEEDRLFSSALDLFVEDSRMQFGSMRAGLTAEMDPYERYLAYDDIWSGWDWKSYWLSAFASLKFDTFDDGYFPNKGIRFSIDGRYVFKGYSIDLDEAAYYHDEWETVTEGGAVPDYWSAAASFEAAFTFWNSFTILPSIRAGWYCTLGYYKNVGDTPQPNLVMNPKHVVTFGGFMPNRYTERQIPFIGFPTAYKETSPISVSPQLDLRYRFLRKNYVTLRGAAIVDAYYLQDLQYMYPVWAVGLEYSRQTMVGPLRFAVQRNNIYGFNIYASIGFDF